MGHFWGKWEVLLCFLKSAYLHGDAASLSHLSSTLTTHSTHHLHFITAQWIYYIHRIPPSLLNKLVAINRLTTFRQGSKTVAINRTQPFRQTPTWRPRKLHTLTQRSFARKNIGPKTRPQTCPILNLRVPLDVPPGMLLSDLCPQTSLQSKPLPSYFEQK